MIANKMLGHSSLIHETIRIKSGAWDDSGIFVYSTLNHIKYALPQGSVVCVVCRLLEVLTSWHLQRQWHHQDPRPAGLPYPGQGQSGPLSRPQRAASINSD